MKLNTEDENIQDEKPQAPKNKLPKWTIPIGVIVLIAGFAGMIFLQNKPKPKQTEPSTHRVEKAKTSESKTTESAEKSTEQSTVPSTEAPKPQPDMTPQISDFFTKYQEYDTSKITDSDRAKSLQPLATDDVINKLIPEGLSGVATGGNTESLIATYKLTSAPEVQKVVGKDGYYTVVLDYSVSVAGNSSQHEDSYTVSTKDGKIDYVNLESYTSN